MTLADKLLNVLRKIDENIQFSLISVNGKNFRRYTFKKYGKQECATCNGNGYISTQSQDRNQESKS